MDRAMIPLDQEYGKRKETVALMGQAGAPQGANAGGAAPNAGAPAAQAGPADFLAARAPSRPVNWAPPDPLGQIRQLVETSPNLYVRAVLKRMLEETGGP